MTLTKTLQDYDEFAKSLPQRKYNDDEFEEDYPILFEGQPLKVQIENQTYGPSSTRECINTLQKQNVSSNTIKKIELAQLLAEPEGFGWGQAELDLIQGIIASDGVSRGRGWRTKGAQKKCENSAKMNKNISLCWQEMRKRLLVKEADAEDQKQKDKKAKRNAKRRAKAKKNTLNFTPTKEQEKDVAEWFWGEAPGDN